MTTPSSNTIPRRTVLQAGATGMLGISLPQALAARNVSAATPASPKSVLIVFLTGACSHHDTFDMKPEAPAEIRGEFRPIATSVPGIQICEHLPLLAARAHKYALVRSMSHGDNNHLMSTHHVLTGAFQPGAFFDKVASRDDWPSYAGGSAYLRPRSDGIPSGVNLPTFLMEGPLTWPGQHAGFLGPKYDQWQINGDPNDKNFQVDALTLPQGVDVPRLDKRRELLDSLNRQQRHLADIAQSQKLSNEQQLAFSILTSSRFAEAFQLQRESDAVRDRYGRHTTGQSLLLARRLVQAGVPVVQTNIGRVQNWDHHAAIFTTLKGRMLSPLDQGVSALLDDLDAHGILNDTLVIMLGEFGRTPKINAAAGRDHWGPCFFAMFAGAGVQGGQVIGRSDDIGAYPVTPKFSPDDLGATVYQTLGIDPESELRDRLNRPVRLNKGKVMSQLFTGGTV
ncbi:MAG: DUF1501 domain-containing protein [Planctomycetaceae bacterium]|nr:DUF1501 domain-containing protein [Planctomycetaceae bacterium]